MFVLRAMAAFANRRVLRALGLVAQWMVEPPPPPPLPPSSSSSEKSYYSDWESDSSDHWDMDFQPVSDADELFDFIAFCRGRALVLPEPRSPTPLRFEWDSDDLENMLDC